jgi:hypothetical protein
LRCGRRCETDASDPGHAVRRGARVGGLLPGVGPLKLTLHIGLLKTATTTIQHVLETAKPDLAARGVLYPGTTRSQLELVGRSQLRQPEGETGPGSLGEAMGWVADEVRAVRPEHVVISCERMSLVSAGSMTRMQRAIAAWLPEVRDLRILAYVRDPISWATSLCQQRLKMGTSRLVDFADDPWPIRLEEMLEGYVSRYGLQAVNLRLLHPDHLVNGNVVDDFLSAIGQSGFPSFGPAPVLNQSLSQLGAQVAEVLAVHAPRGTREGLRKPLFRRLLQEIEGERFVLPRAVQERVVVASRGDVDYIGRFWGLDLRPRLVEPPDVPGLPEDVVLTLAADLMDEVERLVAEAEGEDGA